MNDNNDIMVSIVCLCFNHAKYIETALKSFVGQKTKFKYEIIIHDDASTDESVDIIRKYQSMYPDLIRPIFQDTNQFSRGTSICKTYIYPKVNGRYIAFCEGDDYWIDPYKIQKQFDALEKNPLINICSCGTKVLSNGKITSKIAPSKIDTIFTPEQVIMGGGGFVATNSIMLRKEPFLNSTIMKSTIPLDYFTQIAGAIPNGMIYLKDIMCVYRYCTEGSWTARVYANPDKRINHMKNVNHNLSIVDEVTSGHYHDVISKHILDNEISILITQNKFSEIRKGKFRQIYSQYSLKKKFKIYIRQILYTLKIK